MFEEQVMFIDTETFVPNGSPDPESDILRYVGFSYKGKKNILHYTEHEEIQRILSFAPYLCGHNFIGYDKRILERAGFNIGFKQIVIDTYKIAENRLKSMLYMDLNQGDMSLRRLAEIFNLPCKKGTFDYSLLAKERLDGEEYNQLEEYLWGDLDTCEAVYKFFYEMFVGFKELMSKKDQLKMRWLINKPGSTAYAILCNKLGIEEEYNDDVESKAVAYEGAFVSEPYCNYVEGNIYLFDFASLYPNCFIGGNLFSPQQYGWNGSKIFPNEMTNEEDGIKGSYATHQGKMEQLISWMFLERKKIPKTDPRNLAYKIVLNTLYGITGCKKFKNVYNLTTASDCTALARRCIKYARYRFKELNYESIYSDTDSCFVKDPYNNDQKIKNLAIEISNEERSNFNIPSLTHNLAFEAKIKRMYFFKNDEGKYNKKCYIYVDEKDKIKAKGIRIVRGDCSPIAKTIYNKYIVPLILKGGELNITFSNMKDWFILEAKENPELLKIRYRLKPIESYKIIEGKEEAGGIHAQLSKKYGIGEKYFIINKRLGPGKGNHYCTLEELQSKYGTFWVDQVKLECYISDLKLFLNQEERKKIKKELTSIEKDVII